MKKILIVSFIFPPYPGIGGRRWMKFAKYLDRKECDVHVICANNPFPHESGWNQDRLKTNISLHSLPSAYPLVLQTIPKTLISKAFYRLAILKCRLFERGNYYDRSVFWKKKLLFKTREIIKSADIDTLIVTGPPFKAMYDMLEVKTDFPSLKLIGDFRDPWTDSKRWGIGGLDKQRFSTEIERESRVINGYDLIISPSEEINKKLMDKCHTDLSKFVVIPHAFDADDIPPDVDVNNSEKIRLVYAGTLYEEMDEYFKELVEVLCDLREYSPEKYQKLSIEFYSDYPQYQSLFQKENIEIVSYHNTISGKEVLKVLNQADYIIYILNHQFRNYFSTKFYEIMALKKPLLFIGSKGQVAEFIKEKNLGLVTNKKHIREAIDSLFNVVKSDYSEFRELSHYSFDSVTDKLIQSCRE